MSPRKKSLPTRTSQPLKAKPPKVFTPGADPLAVAPSAVSGVAAALAGFVPELPAYDAALAKELVETWRPRLAAIAPERIVTARLNIDAAARTMLSVYAFVTQAPGLLARFQKLAGIGEFDIANIEHLKSLTFVMMYQYREAAEAGAFTTQAKVPAALDAESKAVEAEMQSVLEHNFRDHPVYGPLLDYYRPGTSYEDRANDLLGYDKIYEAEHDILSKDTKYKPTHRADARRLAGEILAALGAAMSPKAREVYDLLQRGWTLGSTVYSEIRQTATYLLRYDPQVNQRFPSLFAAGRSGVGQKKNKKGAGNGDGGGATEGSQQP